MSYPYPPDPAYPGQSNAGFAQQTQGPGYPLYPPAGGGAPCPPPSSNFGFSGAPPGAQYPPQPTGSYPYPPQPSQYQQQPGPYPNQSYPPQSASPNPQYPPQSSPNPSPYPPQPGLNSSPYPPQPGQSPSPYPPYTQGSSYPANPGTPYDPNQGSPYPPSNVSTSMGYPGAAQPPVGQSNIGQCHATSMQQNLQSNYGGCMWPYQARPTLRPAVPFDPSSDAALLKKAMKGFGTDEAAIIQVLGRRTFTQRQDITLRYQQSFGKDLVKDLKSELSGDFESVVVALMTPPHHFMAQQLHDAVAGIGTKENTLIDVLCANDNETIRSVKAAYQTTYGKPLEADLRGDTSGYFGRLMVAMAAGFRDETTNVSLAPGLAQSLYKAGVKKVGTDESEFIRVLSCYSYPLLRCVFEEYKKVSGGKSLESAIKSELSGDFEDGLLAVYECINNQAAFFARFLYEAMKGAGTKDEALIRIVVLRSEIDMGNIKDEFRNKYGKKLEDAISSETSGDYKKILLKLIEE